jgi:hypothetical protein
LFQEERSKKKEKDREGESEEKVLTKNFEGIAESCKNSSKSCEVGADIFPGKSLERTPCFSATRCYDHRHSGT